MKKGSSIHNLDTLEREIYRLKLEAKNKEDKLNDNLESLQKNFPQVLINSFLCRKKYQENGKEGFFRSAFRNEKFNTFIDKVVDKFSDRAADGIDHLFEKIFHKKK
jgi:hypothetical protein